MSYLSRFWFLSHEVVVQIWNFKSHVFEKQKNLEILLTNGRIIQTLRSSNFPFSLNYFLHINFWDLEILFFGLSFNDILDRHDSVSKLVVRPPGLFWGSRDKISCKNTPLFIVYSTLIFYENFQFARRLATISFEWIWHSGKN